MSDILSEISSLVDAELLDWLRNGKPVTKPDGSPVMRRGKPVTRKLTAAEMTAILRRISTAKTGGMAGASTNELEAEAERRRAAGQLLYNGKPVSHPVPPLDTENLEDRRA